MEVEPDHEIIQKEYMFEKVVTPSDVGKLNRLVIPKRHAEEYFPSVANNEKCLLLSFEDKNGKPWKFGYSYWNSSQSYVMTKGWTKFVKEKKLGAGDIVIFGRGAAECYKDRYYIDWKHQPYPRGDLSLYYHLTSPPSNFPRVQNLAVSSPMQDHLQFNYGWQQHHYYKQQVQQRLLPSTSSTRYDNYNARSEQVMYVTSTSSIPITNNQVHDCQAHHHQYEQDGVAGLMQQNCPGEDNHSHMEMIHDSVPVVHGKSATKRVRLFGVNI